LTHPPADFSRFSFFPIHRHFVQVGIRTFVICGDGVAHRMFDLVFFVEVVKE